MNPRVSVCIPSYNLSAFIGRTIESVLNQTFTDFELLIEDDGSTDNSVAVISGYNDPRILLVSRLENAGQNATTNNLVRRAKGEYLALLPADDVWEPEKLSKQVAFLDANQTFGAVFSHPEFINEADEIIPGDAGMAATQAQGNMARAFWQKRLMVSNCLFIATSMYRRAMHEEHGYFEETLHLLADLEFYARIVKTHEIHVLPERLARVRMRGALNLSAPTHENSERHADEIARVRLMHNPRKIVANKFYIATPFYEMKGYSPYIESLVLSLTGLAKYEKETGIRFEFHQISGDSYVWRARNSLAAMFLKSECSHLVFIDSDESWEPEGFFRLLKADAPMVGAAYPVKNNWGHFGVTFHTEGENHTPKVREDGLILAQKVPTGFMKISREVFERIRLNEPENWYWQPDEYGTPAKVHNYFGHVMEDHVIYGEDISFNKRWQACGGEIYIEPRVTIEHYGMQGWKGNLDTFLRQQPGGDLDPALKAAA